jgi:hypothetical protein
MGEEVKFHPVSWSKMCFSIPKMGLGVQICSCSTEFFWGSGYDVMLLREKPCGDWKWALNNEVSWVDDALMDSMGCMGCVSRNSLGEVGRSFLVLLDLRWGTTPRLVFGMPSGVGSNPLREHIRSWLALPALGMHPW